MRPVGTPWFWTLAYAHLEDRTPTHGYEATCEAAMAAFAKSWRRKVTKKRRTGTRRLEDAADYRAFTQHVVVVVAPLAGWATS